MKDFNEDIFNLNDKQLAPVAGSLLVAKPTVDDNCFGRSVILVISHDNDGSMGLILNRPTTLMLPDVIDFVNPPAQVRLFLGGPVGENVMFFIHTLGPEVVPGSQEVAPGIFFAGDFEALKFYIERGGDIAGKVKFFAGYSGWTGGQLMGEIERQDWAVLDVIDNDVIMGEGNTEMWQWAVSQFGTRYRLWNNFPLDPCDN